MTTTQDITDNLPLYKIKKYRFALELMITLAKKEIIPKNTFRIYIIKKHFSASTINMYS